MYTAILELLAWLSGWLGKRVALVSTFVVLISTFYATMLILVAGATAAVATTVPEWVYQAGAIFLPSETGAAMAAVVTARVARWVYDMSWKVAAIAVLLH